jgi:broad specificity phosphatase PhoE
VTRVFLVRHGQTEWNATGRLQGHSDSQLSERGRAQAQAIAARLSREQIHAVYASDLSRASDTAAPIAEAHGLDTRILPALREISYGQWEGQTQAELERNFPEVWQEYHVRRRLDYAVPGGESWRAVFARVTAALEQILQDHHGPDEAVVLVGHGGSLRIPVLHALGAPLDALRRIPILGNASLSRLDYRSPEEGRIVFLNETAHCESRGL